jgi:hypothetical protein
MMRLVGCVAHMEEKRSVSGVLVENPEGLRLLRRRNLQSISWKGIE